MSWYLLRYSSRITILSLVHLIRSFESMNSIHMTFACFDMMKLYPRALMLGANEFTRGSPRVSRCDGESLKLG